LIYVIVSGIEGFGITTGGLTVFIIIAQFGFTTSNREIHDAWLERFDCRDTKMMSSELEKLGREKPRDYKLESSYYLLNIIWKEEAM
jgi:hypothetical protein